jgi:hypothetical protein
MASGELACTYAALILSDDGIAITVRSSPSLSVLLISTVFERLSDSVTFLPGRPRRSPRS